MKKVISLLICILFLTLSVSAAVFENPPVSDDADYLVGEQLEELSERLEKIRNKYNFDVAIVTEYSMSGDTAQESADDIFDYSDYGAGKNSDGILFYICASEREYHFSTHARGEEVFNKSGIKYLKENIEPYLKDNKYYLAMEKFAELSEELLEMAENGEPYNETESNLIFVILGSIPVALVIALILMLIKLAKMKTVARNNYAANYMKEGSRTLSVSRDLYLYSHIRKIPKPKNNSGSHRSSSGRSHGGGGGSF